MSHPIEQGSFGHGAESVANPALSFCATLVDEWARAGVTDAVVCPGSRSTPMALALARDDRIALHVHHDERAAGFMALGIALASGRPAVVLTTSGTAAVELHPAVVEAHQARVPLIVCTADRPPELQGVGAPQTIDQVHLFGSAVRASFDPGPPGDATRDMWRSMAAHAFIASTGIPPGPVQVNLQLRDPLVGGAVDVPQGRRDGAPWHSRLSGTMSPDAAMLDALFDVCDGRRGVIIAGAGAGDVASVVAFAHLVGWPVLADPRSACRISDPAVVTHFDPLLRTGLADELVPDVVMQLGDHPASKVLSNWTARSGATHVSVQPHGSITDPQRITALNLVVDPAHLCRGAAERGGWARSDDRWLACWSEAQRVAAVVISEVLGSYDELTEPGAARVLSEAMAPGSSLVVSSSMPVRDLEWYTAACEGVRVFSNRGANGIDGVVSTALGVALTGSPTAVLVGDVAFLHDSNALVGATHRGVDLTMVVVDNDGGGIFSFLPQAELVDRATFEKLFGTPHGVDLTALAAVHGVTATRVRTVGGLAGALADSVGAGGVHLVVVESDRELNLAVHRELNSAVASALSV